MTTFIAERNADMIVHYNLGQSVIFFFAAHMLSHSVLCADLVPSIGQIILRTRISGYHFPFQKATYDEEICSFIPF